MLVLIGEGGETRTHAVIECQQFAAQRGGIHVEVPAGFVTGHGLVGYGHSGE